MRALLGIGVVCFTMLLPAGWVVWAGGVSVILDEMGDLSDPTQRLAAVEQIRQFQQEQRAAGRDRALALGLPVRVERADGTVKEVAGLDVDGNVLYVFTHNDRAAISTGANLLHQAPYTLSGTNVVIGMWDGGAGRSTHREFEGTRMVIMDGASPIAHATHVGGTLAAAGITARAKGMAPAARVDSYDWNDDKAEMTARAATEPGDPEALLLSNHSYGIISGWFRTGGSNPAWIWYGSGSVATSIDPRFGQYNTFARDSDAIAYNAPYYLMFRSAGNDRTDNPAAGQMVQLSSSSSDTVAYDPALHPAGDGVYRGGYDTIGFDAVAKNVITVGSVSDAVSDGLRDPGQARMSNFSSWGPTDDGRIKPDIVANGEGVYSTFNGGDSSYGIMSGTSMSSPNAAGTAALLVDKYAQLFPGEAMRASTLKGLLIHTADDLGTPGPNYQYGWGLMNAVVAAELLGSHASHPEKKRMQEDVLHGSQPEQTYAFVWDGVSPIRATLSWTDPPGTATTSSDLRSARLRNNLDLRIIGPDDTVYYPYVMPFVGTWTVDAMSLAATNGVNNTDNVEQVYIAAPASEGVYVVSVTHQGTLVDGEQVFSLLLDGASGEEPPPPPLRIESISPESAFAGSTVLLDVKGTTLSEAVDLRLVRMGHGDIAATNLRMQGSSLLGDLDLTGAAIGVWDVAVASLTQTNILTGGFTVREALWSESFDGTVTGWQSQVIDGHGNNNWVLTDTFAHTDPNAYFAPAPSTRSDTALISPSISIPEEAIDLRLHFYHAWDLEFQLDGGRLEVQLNGGDWIGVGDEGSGTQFLSRGYTASIRGTGPPNSRSSFAGKEAWTGDSGGFVETIVSLIDTDQFAGSDVRFRWYLATDNNNASPGWYVDSIALLGDADLQHQPPVIVEPIEASGAEEIIEEEDTIFAVSGGSALMTVLAESNGDTTDLLYRWSSSGPAPVYFMPNDTAESNQSEAYFEALGDYTIQVTVSDSNGLSVTDAAKVRILQEPTSIDVQPSAVTLRVGEQRQFDASLLDQFSDPMSVQPESFEWSVSGGGVINSSGVFEAHTVGENIIVTAASDALAGTRLITSSDDMYLVQGSGTAQMTVLPGIAKILFEELRAIYDGQPKSAGVATSPEGLDVWITYDGDEALPALPGEYAIVAVVDDENYEGETNAVFTIAYDGDAYEAWVNSFGLSGVDADPGADPAGSGMSNLYKWRFGFDPTDPDDVLRLRIEREDDALWLVMNRAIPDGVFTILRWGEMYDDWYDASVLRAEDVLDAYRVVLEDSDSRGFWRVRFELDYEGF